MTSSRIPGASIEPSTLAASVAANTTEAAATDGAHQAVGEEPSIEALQLKAKELRRLILTMLTQAGSGHTGGSLSTVEVLTALYYQVMRHDPARPSWPDRDRFILSKGHAAPALYAVLADTGYFPKEELSTLRKLGSRLQGHTDSTRLPGVEMSAGSLGQGLSFSIGSALAARLDGRTYRVYALLGDGECQEGQVWEAAMAAAHYELDNLVSIVDLNGIQNDSWVHTTMRVEPMAEKWRSFGWHVLEIDGHDFLHLLAAFREARETKKRPTAIIARTIKGKGISFVEHNLDFITRPPTPGELERALAELQ